MNTKASIAIFGAAALAAMLGCSTPKPASPVAEVSPVPPPELSYDLPLEPPAPPWNVPFGKVCRLSTSCIAMDPRPFEPCLLSTKECSDKATEPLLVLPPMRVVRPPMIQTN
jgi:hypothetical protein